MSQHPTLVIPSQPTKSGLRGYLDPRNPHTINHLLVQRLGNDEVVATVRDDGDVEAVLVRHIVQAIARRSQPGSSISAVADEIRPIFQDNVGISAWGLAIHSEARILATSSNAHEVRIFKFGLLQSDEDVGGPNGDDGDETAALSPAARWTDVKQRVLNGNANIPCIAFCNTGDDPHGRWLLTTDISGHCRVMDLSSGVEPESSAQHFSYGGTFATHGGFFDRINAGWTIGFLDTRAFQAADNFEDALGLRHDETLPGLRGNPGIWDLSDTSQHVPENSATFTANDRKSSRMRNGSTDRSASNTQLSSPLIGGQTSEEPSQPASDFEALYEDDDADAGGVSLTEVDDELAAHVESSSDIEHGEAHTDTDTLYPGINRADADEDVEPDEDASDDEEMFDVIGDDEDLEDEGTEDSISWNALYGGRRIFGNQPQFYRRAPLCDDLPCPILHASVKNVYILQPSQQHHHPGPFSPPVVGFANPLRQAVQVQFAQLNSFDRLNMSAHVVELGVVVVASQKGRAMVLALTKLRPKSTKYPAELQQTTIVKKTVYAMRLEDVLPFAWQERDRQRPFAPLHGIAVGPMQGTENAPSHLKRWRLMLMYQDHSVLSYELKRRRAKHSGVDVASLVV